MNVTIPDGLGDLLRDFTVAVLKEKPKELYEFAAEWFVYTRDTHRMRSIPMYIIADDDDEEHGGKPPKEPALLEPKTLGGGPEKTVRSQRRHSVSAERYDPEADTQDQSAFHAKTDDQRARLRDSIDGILLFKSVDPDQIQKVIDAMFERKTEPGELVIKKGEDGDNFYVIDTGDYEVLTVVDGEEKCVFKFEGTGSFGELALMYNMPRSATIRSVGYGSLWAMDRASFRSIIMKSAFQKHKMYEELLESVPILQSLDPYDRMNLTDALCTKVFKDGECIIKEGDEADGMYFIEAGEVSITVMKDDKEIEVAQLSKGRYFGEAALVNNKLRSASVRSIGCTRLAFLEKDSFERLLGPCMDVMRSAMATYKSETK